MAIVAEYLRSLDEDTAALAAVFLCGTPFPRCEQRTLNVGGRLLFDAIQQLTGADDDATAAAYRRYGDGGSAVGDLLFARPSAGLTLSDLARTFDALSRERAQEQKIAQLVQLFAALSGPEAKYAAKIITGDMRIGLKESLVEEAIARAFERPLAAVQRANMIAGDIGLVARLARRDHLSEARLRLFTPLGSMLASSAETAEELMDYFPDGALVEDKYDGIRAQAHKQHRHVRLYSRTLDEITEFPELIPALAALPGDFILDGEIIAWDYAAARPLPFTTLQPRLGRKQLDLWTAQQIPVRFIAFDLLYVAQASSLRAPESVDSSSPPPVATASSLLLDQSLSARRKLLASLLSSASSAVSIAPAVECRTADELHALFEAALARGNEGLVAKDPASPYTPGRRGKTWLKLKRPLATLDVVVVAVEFGHGKRHRVLSDYTFAVRDGERLAVIGRAYSGLTDAEIAALTEWFKEHTLEDSGFRRTVEPRIVIEVAFNNIQRSARHDSGFALRFPRIVRLRPDKAPAEIDTLDRVREVYSRQVV